MEQDHRTTLINQISGLFAVLQQEPAPVAELLQRLVESPSFDYSQVLSIEPRIDFKLGLSFPSVPVNLACLTLLHKATFSSSDAAIVASDPGIILALVELWLSTSETAVASKALRVLSGLLEIDVVHTPHGKGVITSDAHGQGLMWRRMLRDRDIYGRIFSLCSMKTLGQEGQPNARHKTIAQARLLEFLSLFAKYREIQTSQLPAVEKEYGVSDGGLLEFAAVHMIDYEDDIMLHADLIAFFARYVSQHDDTTSALGVPVLVEPSPHSSAALDFLISKGLHSRTISYFVDPKKHSRFIHSQSALYISAYVSRCPNHFLLVDQSLPRVILRCLSDRLRVASWAEHTTPTAELRVASSLPPKALLPQPDQESPLFLVPTRPANTDALHTLSIIFSYSAKNWPKTWLLPRANREPQELLVSDRVTSELLYTTYLAQNPLLWHDIVSAARTVALKEQAIAAVHFIGAIVLADWNPLDGKSGLAGIVAILLEPTCDVVLPYLMEQDQAFSGVGDSSSAAYSVAMAKHEVLVLFYNGLKDLVASHEDDAVSESWQELLEAVRRRVAQGPLRGSTSVGGHVASMEL